ncbi:hypothetical protein V8C42DRAFT_346268 [Trichoderma barbatum]
MKSIHHHFMLAFAALNIPLLASAQAAGSITCYNGKPNTIQKSDISGLIREFRSGNQVGNVENPIDLRSVLTLGKPQGFTFFAGSVNVDISNGQPFASTHVTYESLAGALQALQDTCCGAFPTCIGGETGVRGDTGLVIHLLNCAHVYENTQLLYSEVVAIQQWNRL